MKNILALALVVALINVCYCDIPAHKITGDTSGFTEVTSVYKDTWYSGYLDIDSDTQIHYWFFPVFDNLEDAPLVIWLNSGPSCTGLYDATHANGPFIFQDDSSKMKRNEYGWRVDANVLYFDPPGVGFSKRAGADYQALYKDSSIVNIQEATIRTFFESYSEYKNADVYIAGQGYAGVYVPLLALLIHETNENPMTTGDDYINIKGILTGNAATNKSQINLLNKDFPYHTVFYLKDQGILSWDQVDDFTNFCGYQPEDLGTKSDDCKAVVQKLRNITQGLNMKDINADCYFKELGDTYTCTDDQDAAGFFNKSSVKKALHVDEEIEWSECNSTHTYKSQNGSLYAYPTLMKAGIRVWTYSGDADADIPHTSTLDWINTLREDQGLSDIVGYSSWFYQDGIDGLIQNGGSYWLMDRLTYIRFKGCGQNVAECNPIGAQEMFKQFLQGGEMELDPLAWM